MQSRKRLRRVYSERHFHRKRQRFHLPKSHNLKEYCSSNPQVKHTDVAFKAQLLLAVQEESTKFSYAGNQNDIAKQFRRISWHISMAYVVNTVSITSPSRLSRRGPKLPPLLAINAPTFPTTRTSTSSAF